MAPAATVMAFWPSASTLMKAAPVGSGDRSHAGEIDAIGSQQRQSRVGELVETGGADEPTSAPARRAASAWLAPLPPGTRA